MATAASGDSCDRLTTVATAAIGFPGVNGGARPESLGALHVPDLQQCDSLKSMHEYLVVVVVVVVAVAAVVVIMRGRGSS